MHRPEVVDMRQNCPHAQGSRLEPLVAQERIEPDESAAGFVQPLHLLGEPLAGVAVEPVGDENDKRALAEHAARPAAVELAERGADARSPRPVLDRFRHAGERHIHVALAQLARDVGEPRAEEEGIDAVAVVGERMEEVQQHARIAAHRARDVAEDDEGRVALAPPAPAQIDVACPAAQRIAQGRPHVDAGSGRIGAKAPRGQHHDGKTHARHHRLGRAHLVPRHLLEVHLLENLAVRIGHRGVGDELRLGRLLLGVLASARLRGERFRKPAAHRLPGQLALGPAHRR